MTIFSSTWNRLHGFFFLHREILHGTLCKDDTYILFFSKKSSMAPVLMARQEFKAFGTTRVQG